MKILKNFKVILWDFDGVILDSMPIRSLGFKKVLEDYPEEQVKQLLDYHEENGGLSRYVKLKYFFENIRGESISDELLAKLTNDFSKIMLSLLIDEKLLISNSVNFIKNNYNNYVMHIVSGSDGKELNIICEELNLKKYFKSILGSPTPKIKLVEQIITENAYSKNDMLLIGDSINDFEASKANDITFIGYNNPKIRDLSYYMDSFENA
ncbi:HAD family hydrolase [Sphingobacterium sp. Mn56C]|uniref:HAD family hydrolase n=1 Tax=Sphingobacterium sp. Mn56C TaxID=3395261 RepID=UPI003BE4928B